MVKIEAVGIFNEKQDPFVKEDFSKETIRTGVNNGNQY